MSVYRVHRKTTLQHSQDVLTAFWKRGESVETNEIETPRTKIQTHKKVEKNADFNRTIKKNKCTFFWANPSFKPVDLQVNDKK